MKSFSLKQNVPVSGAMVLKKLLPIPLFYMIDALVIYLLQQWAPCGPCGIDMDMFTLLFVFIPVSAGLLLYNIRRITVQRKINAVNAALHLVGLLLTLKVFW